MFDRVSMLVGAGIVTAGVSAAMLAGAGVAVAATESGGGETSTSGPSAPVNARSEPDNSGPDTQTDATDEDKNDDADGSSEESNIEAEAEDEDGSEAEDNDTDGDAEAGPPTEPAPEADNEDSAEAGSDDPDTDQAGHADSSAAAVEAAVESSGSADPSAEQEGGTTLPVAEDSADAAPAAEPTDVSEPPPGTAVVITAHEQTAPEPDVLAEATPAVARLALVSAADTPTAQVSAPRQTLLSLVGTVMFNLYSFAVRVFGGPPLLPWGSTVTVRSSAVTIDCGDGYEVPADWYVPEGPTPTRLIYLQHGFLAAGPFYSYTASRLAEATHSIVVTTSLTSNFLACDGCWVGGSPMHKAVADLFLDGNTALADSASAAGYSSTLLAGVEKVVLMGHSAGGGLAAGAAGYMAENGTIDRLAGVVMLDGVGFAKVVPEALAKLPDELPIYNLAGKAYFWNMNGSAAAALEKARSGKFNGVRLIGGLHSDTMLGGNPLVQAGLNLVTGWSKIENVKGAEVLSAAWVNDMFAGAPTPGSPYYGTAGSMLEIETTRGTATAYVMPGPTERLTVFDVLFQYFVNIIFGINFATCVAPSTENAPISAPDMLLSLDGRAKPGQSIGQHVCTG